MRPTTPIISLNDVKRSCERRPKGRERTEAVLSGRLGENGGAYRGRTGDFLLAKQALCQLS